MQKSIINKSKEKHLFLDAQINMQIHKNINIFHLRLFEKNKGPDNPTSQLLPILSFKSSSGDGEGRKDKGGGERLCVKVCEKIVCMYACICMYVRTLGSAS